MKTLRSLKSRIWQVACPFFRNLENFVKKSARLSGLCTFSSTCAVNMSDWLCVSVCRLLCSAMVHGRTVNNSYWTVYSVAVELMLLTVSIHLTMSHKAILRLF